MIRITSAPWLWIAVLAAGASGQTLLKPQDVGVVTTEGVYHFRPGTGAPATQIVVPASFVSLTAPALEWERGTDSFLVAAGPQLARVTVVGDPPTTAIVTDITPVLPGTDTPVLADLDLNPATGRLYLLDRGDGMVHRYPPPFGGPSVPEASFSVPKSARSICVDSRSHPEGIFYTANDGIYRLATHKAGADPKLELLLYSGNGGDIDPQVKNSMLFTKFNGHKVGLAAGSTMVFVDLNLSGFCQPVARGPRDIEWDPVTRRAHVLAEEGVGCIGGFVGGNHIVRMPVPAGGPTSPNVLTPVFGSGIGGTNGDLAVVFDDFAFVAPYGIPCPGPADLDQYGGYGFAPSVGNADFQVRISDAPPGSPLVFVIGTSAVDIPLAGCALLAAPDLIVALPPVFVTDASGEWIQPLPIPSLPILAGFDVFLQVLLPPPSGAGTPAVSRGLQLHLGSV